jgi:hypothetical protein
MSRTANCSEKPESICPAYWLTVLADHDRRARRAAIRLAAFQRLRGRRRKLKPWQFSLGRMFLVVTALCLLLAGRHGREIRKSRAVAAVRSFLVSTSGYPPAMPVRVQHHYQALGEVGRAYSSPHAPREGNHHAERDAHCTAALPPVLCINSRQTHHAAEATLRPAYSASQPGKAGLK